MTNQYSGPHGDIASVTGSPLWGIEVEQVVQAYRDRGWQLNYSGQPEIPPIYGGGTGPQVFGFETTRGRRVIWIPSYGGVLGQDWKHHGTREKVLWILLNSGIKVLVVGGTSGITDWRLYEKRYDSQTTVEPGDMVFPWSFYTCSQDRGLIGTSIETAWPKFDMTLDRPYCPELAMIMAAKARGYVSQGLLRRVHTIEDVRVALVTPPGITFETDFDILDWAARCQRMSEMTPNLPPVLTLHGDNFAPVFCRLAGVHLAYYHLVANRAQGMPDNAQLVQTLHELYCGNFLKVALDYEPFLLETLPVPDGRSCLCISSKHLAPEVFCQAMTQPS